MRISDWSSDVCSSDLAERYEDAEGAFGLGRREQERLQERTRLYRDYRRALDRITTQRNTGGINESLFRHQSEAFRRNLDERLADQKAHFPVIDAIESDWLHGARGCLAD